MVEPATQPEQKAPSRSLQVVIYLLLAVVVFFMGRGVVEPFMQPDAVSSRGLLSRSGSSTALAIMTITFVLTFVAPSSWVNAKREWLMGTMVLSAVIVLLSQLL